MIEKISYIPKDKRKKILLLSDDIRMHSGVATMAREFVVNTAHHFNWYNLGAAIKHPEAGKILDLSADLNKRLELDDACVYVQPNSGYGDSTVIRKLLTEQKPDAIFIFTDPRYWIWLFEIEREIRSKIPIIWLNIWDEYPAPMYNKDYYKSVDALLAISKQTNNINKLVLGADGDGKIFKYVPHGINSKEFYPILETSEEYSKLLEFRKLTLPVDDPEFVVFFNSRNISRKHPADTILAFKFFCDMIGKEKASKCALILHTAASDPNGTDLKAVKHALAPELNIFFSQSKINSVQMNMLYNIADITVLHSSNEGWGLALTESMMAGTMISANVTGGMQDQMRFVNENNKWIDFTSEFPSNHRGTYRECGEWALPVFPSNISLAGSPLTPYIYDDRCMPEDAAIALLEAYNLGKEERTKRGLKAREWVLSEESQMSSDAMCINIVESINECLTNFTPRKAFELIKTEELPTEVVPHKLTGY